MKQLVIPIFLLGALSAACSSFAQTTATVVRSSDLKAKPFSDADTVRALKENERLNVLSRKSSWTEVKAIDAAGWVKMLSLRFEGGDINAPPTNVASDFLNLRKGSAAGSTTTTAVKGLDKESFKKLTPNMEQFQKAQSFVVTKSDAKEFAAQQNLSDQEQAYVKVPGEK